jgi:hypothetical protein
MAYSNFKRFEDIKSLGLEIKKEKALFLKFDEVGPGSLLTSTLDYNIPLAFAIATEKALSELIIMPILVEIHRALKGEISLFSGVEFNVDDAKGLTGRCDFIISRSPQQEYPEAPVMVIVEAKPDNIKDGMPQCIAAMLAAQLFNEKEGHEKKTVYGSVTTGEIWQFLKLEGQTVFIDTQKYYLKNELQKILGILNQVVK